ncbi:transcription factor 4 [Tachysurus ichikawai]
MSELTVEDRLSSASWGNGSRITKVYADGSQYSHVAGRDVGSHDGISPPYVNSRLAGVLAPSPILFNDDEKSFVKDLAQISIMTFNAARSFLSDNAFADKVVINENSCRGREIGSASFRAQFPNAGIMENGERCQLFLGKKEKEREKTPLKAAHANEELA